MRQTTLQYLKHRIHPACFGLMQPKVNPECSLLRGNCISESPLWLRDQSYEGVHSWMFFDHLYYQKHKPPHLHLSWRVDTCKIQTLKGYIGISKIQTFLRISFTLKYITTTLISNTHAIFASCRHPALYKEEIVVKNGTKKVFYLTSESGQTDPTLVVGLL